MPVCKCGTQIQSGTRCSECDLAERKGDDPVADGGTQTTDEDDQCLVKCTDCHARIYDLTEHDQCPNCESRRRRYVGPMQGDTTSTVELRDGETRDDIHASRNAEMLRKADEVLGPEDGDGDE